MLESFVCLPTFRGLFNKAAPCCTESYWYCMGGTTFLMFIYLTVSRIILT